MLTCLARNDRAIVVATNSADRLYLKGTILKGKEVRPWDTISRNYSIITDSLSRLSKFLIIEGSEQEVNVEITLKGWKKTNRRLIIRIKWVMIMKSITCCQYHQNHFSDVGQLRYNRNCNQYQNGVIAVIWWKHAIIPWIYEVIIQRGIGQIKWGD